MTLDSTKVEFPYATEFDYHSDSKKRPLEEDEEKGRRKIKIQYIEDKSRRHITFSKRKAGIMKKAYELSTLTGTQVLLLVASETGHVYTFATPKLQPLITKPEGKNMIQQCLNRTDPPPRSQTPLGTSSFQSPINSPIVRPMSAIGMSIPDKSPLIQTAFPDDGFLGDQFAFPQGGYPVYNYGDYSPLIAQSDLPIRTGSPALMMAGNDEY